jgi:hypothetical protein
MGRSIQSYGAKDYWEHEERRFATMRKCRGHVRCGGRRSESPVQVDGRVK